jgi:purine-cytosine permease-like protein
MVSAAASLTASWSKVTSVAQRRLPAVLVALILASGLCLAVVVGLSALTVERPFLMYLSALISAMSVAVVLIADFPFVGIGVDLAPLSVSASSI